MTEEVLLDDAVLQHCAEQFATAARSAADRAEAPEVSMTSVTRIAGEVQQFLRAVVLARLALSDAATTAGRATNEMMEDGDALDRQLSVSLGGGYSVPDGEAWS